MQAHPGHAKGAGLHGGTESVQPNGVFGAARGGQGGSQSGAGRRPQGCLCRRPGRPWVEGAGPREALRRSLVSS